MSDSLRRSLGLAGLIFTGIVMIQPTAPMPLFGIVHQTARGHVTSAILVAMLGMLLTAISYGRMAAAYPVAGSASSYVTREVHPLAGFLAGWSMMMDYVLNPVICTIWCAGAMRNFFPDTPPELWRMLFAVLFTFLNLRAIQTTARINIALTLGMGCVILAVVVAALRYALGQVEPINWLAPLYDPKHFSVDTFSAGTSLAVLTYIGFDGISTLGEEVKDASRNILRGIVGVCLIIGALSAIESYAAQIVWPYGETLPDVDTAYVHIAGRAGGAWLFSLVNLTLIVATVGSGSGGVLAGARLLYGMGRDGNLPKRLFTYLSPSTSIPAANVVLIGALALTGGYLLTYQQGAELLNFGAFIGFMGVNLSALLHYGYRKRGAWWEWLAPLGGFAICAFLWWNLSFYAKAAGTAWLVVGLLWNGFRRWRGQAQLAAPGE
ncbi:MAG: APC family permease [Bryobacter sp.]|nr:APC family permease [Bryobacter sp.]